MDNGSVKESDKLRFESAVEGRRLEIELFWRRSLFYWGFIAAAFVAFATSRTSNPGLSVVIACFGLICSFAWTLVNRGSKYWQEFWEVEVEESEDSVTGPLFKKHGSVKPKGRWLSARQFSASKITIALSDYTFIFWGCLLFYQTALVLKLFSPNPWTKKIAIIGFICFSILYVILLYIKGRSSLRKDGDQQRH